MIIVGSTGYVGRSLCQRLRETGSSFSTVDRVRGSDPFQFFFGDGYTIIQGDIRDEAFLSHLDGDVIVVLAAETSRERDSRTTANLVFANTLLPAVLGANYSDKKSCIIFASTYSYRKAGEQYFPQTAYSASKFAGERMLEYFSTRSHLSSVVLHIYDVYGPGQPHNRLIPYVYSKVQSGQSIGLSPGCQEIRPVFVGDLVEAIIRLSQEPDRKIGSFEQFDVFGPDVIQVRELPSVLAKVLELEISANRIQLGQHNYREREVMSFDNCHPLPFENLRWTPLAQGLRLTFSGELG